jgi:hypothetical protein
MTFSLSRYLPEAAKKSLEESLAERLVAIRDSNMAPHKLNYRLSQRRQIISLDEEKT